MEGSLILLWLAALPLMGSPGPATLSIAGVGAAYGVRAGLPFLAGICVGTTVVLIAVATGVTGLVLSVPALSNAVTIAAALYILYLAWRIASAPVPGDANAETRPPAFGNAFLLAIANPKAFAAIGAVFSGHSLVPEDPFLDAGLKVAALIVVIVSVNVLWLAFGSSFSLLLRNPRAGRIANIGFAVLLLISVVLAVWPF